MFEKGKLFYFPEGSAKATIVDRGSLGTTYDAKLLVAPGTVAKVARANDRNVTLQTAENRLQGPIHGRLTTEANLPIRDIAKDAQPLTTKDELAQGKDSPLYQAWKEAKEALTIYRSVGVIPGETIPGKLTPIPQESTVINLASTAD